MMFKSEQPNSVERKIRFHRTFKYNVITCTHVHVLQHLRFQVNQRPKMHKKRLKIRVHLEMSEKINC